MADKPEDKADWSLATWEGAERESLRRWAALPLERVIAALEEMQELGEALHTPDTLAIKPQHTASVQEPRSDYGHGTGNRSTPYRSK